MIMPPIKILYLLVNIALNGYGFSVIPGLMSNLGVSSTLNLYLWRREVSNRNATMLACSSPGQFRFPIMQGIFYEMMTHLCTHL